MDGEQWWWRRGSFRPQEFRGWCEAPREPADADVSWKTSFTVGNLMFQGYREWERGYRRQWCIERQVEDDPEHIEDRSNADWCYGSITDGDFVVDGTTYELEGVYHFVAERNDQLNIDFTEEVDLSALAGREFLINGVTFAVNDRSGAQPHTGQQPHLGGAPVDR